MVLSHIVLLHIVLLQIVLPHIFVSRSSGLSAARSMAEPPKKKFKDGDERCFQLMALGRASFVSKSGIAHLLSAMKTDGLPKTFDRSAQYRARKKVTATQTPYGKLVESMHVVFPDGKDVSIACQHPLAWHPLTTVDIR